jgi:hypothetical protein
MGHWAWGILDFRFGLLSLAVRNCRVSRQCKTHRRGTRQLSPSREYARPLRYQILDFGLGNWVLGGGLVPSVLIFVANSTMSGAAFCQSILRIVIGFAIASLNSHGSVALFSERFSQGVRYIQFSFQCPMPDAPCPQTYNFAYTLPIGIIRQ